MGDAADRVARKETDLDQAIKDFEAIVSDEDPPGDWGFKSLKQLTKTTFRRKQFERALGYYKRLLPYTKKAVTRKSVSRRLAGLTSQHGREGDQRHSRLRVQQLGARYDRHAAVLRVDADQSRRGQERGARRSVGPADRQRLSLKTNLKLAKLWLDRREYGRLTKASSCHSPALTSQLIRQLHASIAPKDSDADADADNTRGTILLEIYALEIQMYSDIKDNKKLRAIYEQTLSVRSAVPHPRIMGVIRECGGKMHMFESARLIASLGLIGRRGVVGCAAR